MNTPEIIRRLARADSAWCQTRAFETLLRSVKFICAALVIVLALDLIWQLGAQARLWLAALVALGLIAWLGRLATRAWIGRSPLLRIARHLESRDDSLGSKLVNVLQLEEQANDPALPELTRGLARRAIDEAAHDLAGHQFIPLTKSPTLRRSAWRAMIPLALIVVPALIFAPIAGLELLRFLDPFGDHPPFSFTRLRLVSPADDLTRVVYKKPVTIEAEFSGHRPSELFLTIEDQAKPGQIVTVPMFPQGESCFVQTIDQVTGDLIVRARTKSGRSISEGRHIGVVLTPQLEKASMTVQPPAYTKLPARELPFSLGGGMPSNLTALAGSTLEFKLTSNRPLSRGTVSLQTTGPAPVEVPLEPGAGKTATTATAALTASESGRLRFDLRDESGLSAERELAAGLTVTHDLPPDIAITEPAQDGFIVDTFAAKVAVHASDDYGLKSLRLHTGINEEFGSPHVIEPPADPPQRDALETVEVAPSQMGAKPGDIITVFAEATDIRPEPQFARTRPLKLEVISEDQYNEFLRLETEIGDLEAKYAALHDELKNLAREQRELAEKAEAAKAAAKADGAKAPSPEQRDELAAQQSALNQKLENLAKKMETATRDKPLYDLEKELQKTLDREAEAVRDSLDQNKPAMGEFAKASPSQQALQEFQKEAQAQADRLDPVAKEGEKEMNEALAEAQLMQDLLKSLSAYQEAYREQQELATQTAAYKEKKDLAPEDKLAMQDMAASQRAVGEVLDQIITNLRNDARKAEEAFPEAAQDARDIADAIEHANLSTLAALSSRMMMAARGSDSHLRAEHLRGEMEKLMGQCSQCKSGMGGEFAERLRLMRSMAVGNTFAQMSQCKKFGLGFGQGMAMGGGGLGTAGRMASGTTPGQSPSLLGGESQLGRRADRESATTSKNQAQGTPSPGAEPAPGGATDPRTGINPVNHPSDSAAGDPALDEYRDLVEAYFRRLTTKPRQK